MLKLATAAVVALLSVSAHAHDACVNDVPAAVRTLRSMGTPLRILSTDAYPSGSSFIPHHLQGVARLGSTRTILFSGSSSNGAFLYVGNMETQPEHGRWSSNFKCEHGSCVTPEEDRLTQIMLLGKELPHPGGIQAVGNVVVVGTDHGPSKPSRVRFFDFTDPTEPRELRYLEIDRQSDRAETVGITRLSSGPDRGRYLVQASARNSSQITFYLSAGTDLADPTNFFYESGTWVEGTNGVKTPDYQALQLITQCDGQVFLLGTTGILLGGWLDFIHVFQIDFSTGAPVLKPILHRHMSCRTCLFRAGAGALVDPESGELRYYGSDYWPVKPLSGGPKVLRFEEFTP